MSAAQAGGRYRNPWLTYALLLACVGTFLYGKGAERRVAEASAVALEEAADYLHAHPDLEVPRALRGHVDIADLAAERLDRQRARDRRGAPPIPRSITRRQQEALDALVAEARAPEAELLGFAYGLRATNPFPSSFFSHAFVHGGWLHLAGNLLLLAILGTFLERAWGHAGFAVVAGIGTLAAAATFVFANRGHTDLFVGMTGTVGVLLAGFVFRFARTGQMLSFALIVAMGVGWLFGPAFAGWEPALFVDFAASDVVGRAETRWAAAGGLVFGLAAAALMRTFSAEEQAEDPSRRPGPSQPAEPEVEAALREHEAGRSTEAFERLRGLLERRPGQRDALLAMWDVANAVGCPEDAGAAMLQLVRDEVRAGASVAAVEHWFALSDRGLATGAEPALLIRIALLLREEGQDDAAVRALRGALEAAEPGNPVVSARIARASLDLDETMAEDAAWQALGSMDLDLEERQRLEALLAHLQPRAGAAAARREATTPEESAQRSAPIEPPSQWEDPELSDEISEFDGTVTPIEPPVEGDTSSRPAPIELDLGSRELQLVIANPTGIEEDGLVIETENQKKRIPYHRIGALAVAAIEGLSARPVIVVDVVLNWQSVSDEPLRVIRLRTDRFDPRGLIDGATSPLDALRKLVETLLERSDAAALPDLQAARGLPFASFNGLAAYQRSVLSVEDSDDDAPLPS